jgi:hypothetical protein
MKTVKRNTKEKITHVRVNDTRFFLTERDHMNFLAYSPDINDVRGYLGDDDMVSLLNNEMSVHEMRMHLAVAKGVIKNKPIRENEL